MKDTSKMSERELRLSVERMRKALKRIVQMAAYNGDGEKAYYIVAREALKDEDQDIT